MQPKDVTAFFTELSLSPPNVHVNMKRLCERKPKVLLWDRSGYYLEGNTFRNLSDTLAITQEPVTHITSKALHGLSDLVRDTLQRSFLAETIACYRAGAFRATIVMAWNLAFDHFLRWILSAPERLLAFNQSFAHKYPKKQISIGEMDDLAEVKEYEVIETAYHAKLISKNVAEIMKEKLKRRNAAAHPSNVVITQAQADDVVTDLIHNVVAKLTR